MKTETLTPPPALKEIVCPLVRLDKARRKEKSLSFVAAVVVHIGILFAGGALLIKSPQFAVDQGTSGMEVNLVAAPADPVPVPPEPEIPQVPVVQEKIETLPQERPIKPQPVVEKKEAGSTGKDKMTARSSGGAITEAKPDYLVNPAPPYPEAARRRGQSGTVILKARISPQGNPVSVDIEKSSGYSLLDEAALKAVKKWRFKPGLLGDLPVESTVRVPVKFDLTVE